MSSVLWGLPAAGRPAVVGDVLADGTVVQAAAPGNGHVERRRERERLEGLPPADFCGVDLPCPLCGGDLRVDRRERDAPGAGYLVCLGCGSRLTMRLVRTKGPDSPQAE
jgi:hypothetical protein